MERLDRARLMEIVTRASERLTGEWLLVGGALVALWVESRRTTEDVDLIGLGGTVEERYALLALASDLGLPVEALNSAADFFVRRIEGWRDEIEPFVSGPSATIFKPTPTLFLLLKIGRLSEQDLADCIAVISKAAAERLPLHAERVRRAIVALQETQDPVLGDRRMRVLAALP